MTVSLAGPGRCHLHAPQALPENAATQNGEVTISGASLHLSDLDPLVSYLVNNTPRKWFPVLVVPFLLVRRLVVLALGHLQGKLWPLF